MTGAAGRDARQLPLFGEPRAEPEFAIRPSRRARRLTVRVYPGGRVEVTVPPGARPRHVEAFVARHRRWIDARVAEFRLRAPPLPEPLPASVPLAAFDEEWQVVYRPRARRGWRAAGGHELLVLGDAADAAATRATLRAWLCARAADGLGERLAGLAAEAGLAYERIQVRRQRTRWGSCSRRGTISLNVCLAFQPPPVVRYLLVHELCHTRHMNHSARFWRLVESLEPDWRALDRELLKGWRHVPAWVFG